MRLLRVHEAQTQKRLFAARFAIVPHGVDDLNLIELSDGQDVVTEVGITDDDVEDDVAGREQDQRPELRGSDLSVRRQSIRTDRIRPQTCQRIGIDSSLHNPQSCAAGDSHVLKNASWRSSSFERV
ncbi:MAG: hypothetical protein NTNFB02_24840 [Nitrospira sp.]